MYRLKRLLEFKNLVHGFSTIADGNMSFRWGKEEEVIKNKQKFLESLGVHPASCVQMQVLDDAVVREITPEEAGISLEKDHVLEADALVTDRKDLFLFLVIADCLPMIFFDRKRSVVSLAHLGWKSTDQKLAPAVVGFMKEHYGSCPADIVVGIGPGVKKGSYRFPNPLQRGLRKEWELFLDHSTAGFTAIDVVGYNRRQLIDAGIREENISVSDVDTITSRDFFSHYRAQRAGEKEGRFAAAVGII